MYSHGFVWINFTGIMVLNQGNHRQMAARFRGVNDYNLPRLRVESSFAKVTIGMTKPGQFWD